MVTTQQDRDDALKIIFIYQKIRVELEKIESDISRLTDRKDELLSSLESTRSKEQELIDRIKSQNPGEAFDVLDLVKLF